MKLSEIINLIKKKLGRFEDFDKDNNKLLFGETENEIKRIYFCWRLTSNILKKLILDNNTLIVCHEQILPSVKYSIIPPIKNIFKSNKEKLKLIRASKVNVARFHLSLDSSQYGTNATLIRKLNLIEKKHFDYFSICELKSVENAANFIRRIKDSLNASFINTIGNTNKRIKRVLVVAGGGANKEFISFALSNKCDALISGDSYMESKYFAFENNLLLIDPGHQNLEVPGLKNFTKIIRQNISDKNVKVNFINNEEIESIW